MAWKVTDDPVEFDEAITWFRKRVAMTKAERERLAAEEKRKAFFVSNVAQADLVTQVWAAIDAAAKNGTTLTDFKAKIGPELRKAWGGTVENPAWRLETIFRTNLQNAYGAGRFRQARDPEVLNDRPVWMFDAILDGRETAVCRACDGVKRPADDAWWQSHTPPLHFNCRSGFITLTEKQAGKITLQAPTVPAADGFGSAPGEDEWVPEPSSYPPPIATVLQQKTATPPPPPSPSRLKDGVHVKKVEKGRGVTPETVDDLMASVDDAATLDYLAAHPLTRLAFKRTARAGRKAVSGWYLGGPYRELEVTADRQSDSFGDTFQPGIVHSVSSSMTTKERAANATLRHEIGHHVHFGETDPKADAKVDAVVKAAYRRASAARVYITKYGSTSPREYFAESYAAYYHRRSDLQKHDPNGFAMVEAVLTERGILP